MTVQVADLRMDHSYSTDCRDTYQSKDHSYFRYGRKADPVIHPRTLYDPGPDSGRRDHSYFKLKPLALTVVTRPDAGPDHTYGNMKGSRDRKPLRDAKQCANVQAAQPGSSNSSSQLWPDSCSSIKLEKTDADMVVDVEWVDPAELEKELAQQIVKDHTYTYSKKKIAKMSGELAAAVTTSS